MNSTLLGKNTSWFFALVLALSFLTISSAYASPGLIGFQARIIKPDNTPLQGAAVNFRFTITDPVGTCVIYSEDYNNQNMSNSGGLVVLAIGGGTKAFPAGPLSMFEIFNNLGQTFTCQSGGTYNSGSMDRRKLIVQFNDGSGWQTLPGVDMNSVPFALQAMSAQKLDTYSASDFLRPATLPTCNPATQALTFNGTSFTCVATSSTNGTVTNVTASGTYLSVATSSTTPVISVNIGTTAGTLVAGNDSRITGALQATNNLSELTNAATARTNLGLGSAAVLSVGTASGQIPVLNSLGRIASSAMPSTVMQTSDPAGGDLTGSYPGPSVASVGGRTASNIASTVDAVTAATSSNTSGQIVKRDSSGNFTAGSITATSFSGTNLVGRNLQLNDSGNNAITIQTINSGVTPYTIVLPASVGTSDQVVGWNAAANAWEYKTISAGSGVTINHSAGGIQINATGTGGTVTNVSSTNAYISVATSSTTPAITANVGTTAGTLAAGNDSRFTDARIPTGAAGGDLSGSFPNPILTNTGVTSGANYTKVTVDSKGRVTAAGSMDSSDISTALGFSPLANSLNSGLILVGNGSNVATAVALSGDATINNAGILTLANSGVSAGTYTKVQVDTKGRVIASSSLTSADIAATGYVGSQWVTSGANISYQSGNVGIGTTASSHALEVSGDVNVTGVFRVNGTPISTGGGIVQTVTATASTPITIGGTGTNPTVGITQATGSAAGYLSSNDWNTFNSKLSAITGSTLNSGLMWLGNGSNQAVAVAMSGDARIDSSGNVTLQNAAVTRTNLGLGLAAVYNVNLVGNASSTEVVFGTDTRLVDGRAPIGAAGGDLSGSFPNPILTNTGVTSGANYTKVTVDSKGRVTAAGSMDSSDISTALGFSPLANSLNSGLILVGNGSNVATAVALSGDATLDNTGVLTLANSGVSAGSNYTKFNVDSKGRVTGAGNITSADIAATGYVGSQWVTSGANISYQSGNVGIGTTASSHALEVSGDVNVTGVFRVNGTPISTGGGIVQTVTATASTPITIGGTGTNPTIGITQATGSAAGYLSSNDWNTFNSKLSAITSTDVTTALGFTPISTALNSGLMWIGNGSNQAVAVGMSGDARIDSSGNVTLQNAAVTRTNLGLGLAAVYNVNLVGNASSTEVVFGTDTRLVDGRAPIGAAGGDLSGTYPNPILADSGVTSGNNYTKFNVDSKGRITSAGNLTQADIVALGFATSASASQWTTSGSNISYSAGNVGIGTVNPAGALDIQRSGVAEIKLTDTTGSGGYTYLGTDKATFYPKASGVATFVVGNNNNDGNPILQVDSIAGSTSTGVLKLTGQVLVGNYINSPSIFNIKNASNNEIFNVNSINGNVSVGGSAGAYKVDVSGDVNVSGNFKVNGVNINSGTVTQVTGNGPISVSTSTTTPVVSITQASSSVAGYLSSNDWNTFNNKLSSINSSDISTALGYTPLNRSLNSGLIFVGNGSNIATAVAMSGDATIDNTGVLTLASTAVVAGSNYTKFNVDAKGRITSAGALSVGDISSALGYVPASSASATQWNTSGTTINYVAGNVGIGTANPASLLNVKASGVGNSVRIDNASGNTVIAMGNENLGTGSFYVADSSGTPRILLRYDNALGANIFSDGSATNVADGATGNVNGVGLAIGVPYTVGQENGIVFTNQVQRGAAVTGYTASTASYGIQGLKFKTNDGSGLFTRMTIDETGNVGIGTSGAIAHRLVVSGDVNITGNYKVNGVNINSGTVTQVTGSGPISVSTSTTTPVVSIAQATSSADGYLSQADWTTFNSKLSSITSSPLNSGLMWLGNGSNQAVAVAMSGDARIDSSGNVTLQNAAVTRSNLGLGLAAVYNVNLVGNASSTEVVFGTDTRLVDSRAPAGAAGGDLSGTYPNPILADSGVTAGNNYTKFNVDSKGRVTTAGSLTSADIAATGFSSSQWTTSGADISYSAGKVGVGVTAPASALHVKSSSSGATENGIQYTTSAGIDNFSVSTYSNYGEMALKNSAGAGTIALTTNSARGPHLLIAADANKGDGTDFFGSAIHISAPLNVGQENGISFGNGGQYVGAAVNFYTSSTATYARGGLKFKTSSTGSPVTRMVIDETGNVGIGTMPAAYKLDVSGDINITGNFKINGTNINAGTVTQVTGNGPISVATSTTTPSISIARATSAADGYLTSTDWLSFNNKVSSQWTTSGANIGYASGNVGIGTTNPTNALTVSGAANITGSFTAAGTAAIGSQNYTVNTPGLSVSATNNAGTPLALFGDVGSMVQFTDTAGVLKDWSAGIYDNSQAFSIWENRALGVSGGTERFRIDAGGNIGVGVSGAAAYKLDVSGDINVTGNFKINGTNINSGTVTQVTGSGPISVATSTTTPAISIARATSAADGYLASTDWTSFNNKVSSQWTTSGSDISFASGNVAIGTTNSSAFNAKLVVNGTIAPAVGNVASGASVNLANGNTHTLDSVGGTTITLSNLQHGAQYTLVIRDTTSRTYTFSGCTTSYFKPANGPTTASTRTIYGIMTIQNGANWECYITWSTGFAP